MKEYYKKENLENVVKNSFSFAEVLRKIGLKDMGSNFKTLKKYIELYNLDTSHFRGQTWNKGMSNTDYAAYNKLTDVLNENTNFKSDTLKYRLIREGLKEWKCEKCGNNGIWMDQKLIFEIHHINGNHFDNRLENLQLLCPNCHSQTENYRNRNSKKVSAVKPKSRKIHLCKCKFCGKFFKGHKDTSKFCCVEHYRLFLMSLTEKTRSIKDDNSEKIVSYCFSENFLKKEMVKCHSINELAKKLNTTKTTIRNYLHKYNLYDLFKERYATETIHSKKIIQYDLDMNEIKEWGSIKDAENTLGICGIWKCANFKQKTAGGFIWRYAK